MRYRTGDLAFFTKKIVSLLERVLTADTSDHSMSPYYETHMHCALYAIARCSSVTNQSSIKTVE